MPPPPPVERKPSYIQFTPKRSIPSFENLVALANYEERLKEARKIVWRDRGELPVEIYDLWECSKHATRGGLRAGTLAFVIRAGVNLILLLTRLKRIKREYRFAAIRHALLGEDCFRFAAMLGSFVSIYKYILNALPLLYQLPESQSPFGDDEDIELNPPPTNKRVRKPRLSVSGRARHTWTRKRTRAWFSVVAGAIAGGVAITFEKRSRRITIGQQMFVRGLQGSYNALAAKHGFTVPHGAVWLFSIACAQIMYGFLLRPDTLPKAYISWIDEAGQIPVEAVAMNRDLVRESSFRISDIDQLLTNPELHPRNRTVLLARRGRAVGSPSDFGDPYAGCAAIHPKRFSCRKDVLIRFCEVWKWVFPVYGALHFVPLLLFRRARFVKDPLNMFIRTLWGSSRSSAFLGAFVAIYEGSYCLKHYLYENLRDLDLLPTKALNLLITKGSFAVLGFLAGLSLFVEDPRRRAELAMYVLPKSLESAWTTARGKGYVMRTGKLGEALLTAIGMGMVMRTYQQDPHNLSGIVRRILYQFVGPN